jgi:hypothetical protein
VSFMDLDFGGKGEVKACTARRVVGSPQAAAMQFHNGSADARALLKDERSHLESAKSSFHKMTPVVKPG